MHTSPDEISAYFRAFKDVLDVFKSLGGLLPKGPRSEEAQAKIAEVEHAMRAAEVQLAKALNYNLCQCTFPPQIMLSSGRHPIHGDEIFRCPKCAKQIPSPNVFDGKDKMRAYNKSLSNSSLLNSRI